MSIEDQIIQEQPEDDSKFQLIKEQIIKFADSIEMEKKSCEEMELKQGKEIKYIDEVVRKNFEEEQLDRKESENNFMKKTEDKISNINLNNIRNCKNNEDETNKKALLIENQIISLREQLDLVKKKREENTMFLKNQIQDEMLKVYTQLTVEKKVREETQKKMFNMIEELRDQMKLKMNNEKNDREEFNEGLLKVIEESCHAMKI